MEAISDEVRPLTHADRGSLGARARWRGHERVVVRIDSLHPAVAVAVRALIAADAAARKAAVAVSETPATADAEGHGNDRSAA